MCEDTNEEFVIEAKKYEIFSFLFCRYFLYLKNDSTNSNADTFFYLAVENELLDVCEVNTLDLYYHLILFSMNNRLSS
jgi:hypothetical protein